MTTHVLHKLKTNVQVCLVRISHSQDKGEEVQLRTLERVWRQIATMSWGTNWHGFVCRLLPLCMIEENVQRFIHSGGADIDYTCAWDDLETDERIALGHDFHNYKYIPKHGTLKEKSFRTCTVGDAQLRLLLDSISRAATEVWRAGGHNIPTSYSLDVNQKER